MRVGCPVFTALTLASACGQELRLPSQGGPRWVEVTSEHFTLWTGASSERGRELVRDMERRRQVILTAMDRASSKSRVFVIALRNRFELGNYVPWAFDGTSWNAKNLSGQAGIVVAADNDDSDYLVNHEMAHVCSFEIVPAQPAWLSEGIATYFEMFDVPSHDVDVEVEVGVPRAYLLRVLQRSQPLPSAEIFACAPLECADNRFYATSWATVSFLLTYHHDRLRRYMQRFTELWHQQLRKAWYEQLDPAGPGEAARRRWARRRQLTHDIAWREAFPALPPDTLDRELQRWLDAGQLQPPRIRLTIKDVEMTTRALGDADVLAARSFLTLRFHGDLDAVRRDAAAALAMDRTHVLARLIQAALDHTIAPETAIATAAAHPEDWRAQRLLELAFRGRPEADQAHDRLCALSAGTAPECAGYRSPTAAR